MNYLKHYNLLVERAKKRKTIQGYYELHHIVPKCVGGRDTAANLVKLTAREHFVAHWLLHRLNPDNTKLAQAFKMMCTVKTDTQLRYTPSSRAVEEAVLAAKKLVSEERKGVPKAYEHVQKVAKANLGKKRTKAVREKLSSLKKGKPNPHRAKEVSQYTLSGDYLRTYRTITEAALAEGIVGSNITACCKGKYRQSGNFIWKYGRPSNLQIVREQMLSTIQLCSDEELQKLVNYLEELRAQTE